MENKSEINEKEDKIKREAMEKECVKEFLAVLDAKARERFWQDVMEARHGN